MRWRQPAPATATIAPAPVAPAPVPAAEPAAEPAAAVAAVPAATKLERDHQRRRLRGDDGLLAHHLASRLPAGGDGSVSWQQRDLASNFQTTRVLLDPS